MPRLVRRVPRFSKHRASGQAVVTLSGQDFYLGPHGTKASKLEYDRDVAEWLARGRRPLHAADGDSGEITVVELLAAYKKHAAIYYRKNGQVTNEVKTIVAALKVVQQLYGREPANEFDPLKLQVVQQAMIRLDWCRKQINKQVARIVRAFGWGVTQKMVRADVVAALRELDGLHKGRSEAGESEPVTPVEDAVVNATLEYLPPIVADMVRLQRLTGCRPEEVCMLRPCDVDTGGPTWCYKPASHKNEHHDRERVIFIGPKGQGVLAAVPATRQVELLFLPD